MNNTFFTGTFPGLNEERFDYIETVVGKFIAQL